jgi:hypothetical protein
MLFNNQGNKMKLNLMFAALIALGTSLSAFAQVVNPCEPTVTAQTTRLSCVNQGSFYTIEVHTQMSPAIPQGSGRNHLEIKTADMQVTDQQGNEFALVHFKAGSFTYSAGMSDAKFESPAIPIKLLNCVSPVNGGASFGH